MSRASRLDVSFVEFSVFILANITTAANTHDYTMAAPSPGTGGMHAHSRCRAHYHHANPSSPVAAPPAGANVVPPTPQLNLSSSEYAACAYDGNPDNWTETRIVAVGILQERNPDCAAIMRGVWTESAAISSGHYDYYKQCNTALFHFFIRLIRHSEPTGAALRKHLMQLIGNGDLEEDNGRTLIRSSTSRRAHPRKDLPSSDKSTHSDTPNAPHYEHAAH